MKSLFLQCYNINALNYLIKSCMFAYTIIIITDKKYCFYIPTWFYASHSTMISLLNIQDDISAAFDCKEYSLGFLKILPKHLIQLIKFESLGIRGVKLDWFHSKVTDTT